MLAMHGQQKQDYKRPCMNTICDIILIKNYLSRHGPGLQHRGTTRIFIWGVSKTIK